MAEQPAQQPAQQPARTAPPVPQPSAETPPEERRGGIQGAGAPEEEPVDMSEMPYNTVIVEGEVPGGEDELREKEAKGRQVTVAAPGAGAMTWEKQDEETTYRLRASNEPPESPPTYPRAADSGGRPLEDPPQTVYSVTPGTYEPASSEGSIAEAPTVRTQAPETRESAEERRQSAERRRSEESGPRPAQSTRSTAERPS
jgi:hypothetical protein